MTDASDARAKAVREAARDDHSIGHHRILSCLFDRKDSMKDGRVSRNRTASCHNRSVGCHRILRVSFGSDSMVEGGARRMCGALRHFRTIQATVSAPAAGWEVVP